MTHPISKLFVFSILLPGLASAHTGVGETAGFIHGFSHPVGGADHLLAMLAVGLWAAQIGGKALWAVPCTFLGLMLVGGMLGFSAVPVPFIEGGILVSVLVLGVLIAGAFKVPLAYSALLVGLFAMFHGHAHGTAIPVAMSAVTYTLGFAVATALLHAAGMASGMIWQKTNLQAVSRFAGGAIALSGAYLAIA